MRGTTSVPKLRSCRSVHFIQKQQKKQLIEPEVFVPLGKLINEHEWLLFSGLDFKKKCLELVEYALEKKIQIVNVRECVLVPR